MKRPLPRLGALLLAGVALFAGGCGRVFEGTPEQMTDSLDRLSALPGDTQIYCGHEYTLANCAFAFRVEPDNAALQEREREARHDDERYAHPESQREEGRNEERPGQYFREQAVHRRHREEKHLG